MEFDAVLIEPRIREMTEKGFWHGKTVNDYFDACLAQCADKRALTSIQVSSGARRDLTWRELGTMAHRVAVGLSRLGIGRNDVVACQLPNSWQFVATFLGCARIGAVFNPVMHIFRQRELSFMLKHGEAKAFVVPRTFRDFDHEAMAEEMRPALPDLGHVIVLDGDGDNNFDALLLDPAFDNDPEIGRITSETRPGPNDVCQLIFTSGTTGEPKGVMHTSNTLFSNLVPYAERLRLDSRRRRSDGLAHGASNRLHVWRTDAGPCCRRAPSCSTAGTRTLPPRIIAEEKCTFTMASTPFLMDLTRGRRGGWHRQFRRCAPSFAPAPPFPARWSNGRAPYWAPRSSRPGA